MKKKLTIGILAHVDAGKTTLSEALLYISGKLRSLGRVDHKNTFLDTNAIERERGITIFSKQARFSSENCDFILLDTPGHVDFSAETERTLSLLDYAILVISGSDGVQSHTRTLWQLLEFYKVPTFIFVNKCDIAIKREDKLESEISSALSPACIAFLKNQTKKELDEKLALINEDFLEAFLAGEKIDDTDIAQAISERKLFPCLFGSALKLIGTDFLLDTIDRFTLSPINESNAFAAKVYKISRISSARLTYMKLTGGCLSVKDEISYITSDGKRICEKVDQLRLYSGDKFEQVDSVSAGEICAVIGLSETYVGQGLGLECDSCKPVLEPVFSYRIKLPSECDPSLYFPKLKELEEEDPSLHLLWNDELRQIEVRLMGEIQTDLLKRLIYERFSIKCELDAGKILYKEKIASKAIGVGHFEPLRHYAEVQLLLEPQPKGMGLVFDVRISDNSLEPTWQRLILSHLYEKMHRGILMGAILTDTKITLVAGRAHLKHTEGGDFREATLRAVRNGLMKAGCILLEPYYRFTLEIPTQSVGRAIADLQTRAVEFKIEDAKEDISVICGRGAVRCLKDYARDVAAYTKGKGLLFCVTDGYEPCEEQDRIVAEANYDPTADEENSPHSVFCAHGASFIVPWNQVDNYKHLSVDIVSDPVEAVIPRASGLAKKYNLSDSELEAIMLREFGPIRRKRYSEPKKLSSVVSKNASKAKKTPCNTRNMIIIDGYNVIFAWDFLKALADYNLEKAREALMDILSNYVAFTKTEVILVFDAYLVKDGLGSDFIRDNYRVVFTKKDQTADSFIEQIMHELGPDYSIKVVTGDRLVQFSAVHSGILRMTTKEFEDEVTAVGNEIKDFINKLASSKC